MIHQSDTPKKNSDVAKHTRLFRRGNKYYFRAKVPVDLKKSMGKREIRYSLKTSDPKKALKLVKYESIKIDEVFDIERKKLKASDTLSGNIKVSKLSENEIMRIITRWFLAEDDKFTTWYDKEGMYMDEIQKQNVRDSLRDDCTIYNGGFLRDNEVLNFKKDIKRIFEKEEIEIDENSKIFEKLSSIVRRGYAELSLRHLELLEHGKAKKHDEYLWRFINPNLKTQSKKLISLEKLIDNFLDEQRKSKRSSLTIRAYEAPAGLLFDVIGKKTPISEISHDEAAKVIDLIHFIPVNAKQKFNNKALNKIVELTKDKPEVRKISKTTAANYFININSIFNYAVESKYINDNPFSSRRFRDRFNVKKEKRASQKEQFNIEELNRIFQAPLYTGCKDDWKGFTKKGDNVIKRGRFWIPLLGLFHGFRLNEVCQLYTEDIIKEDGRFCIFIRKELDNDKKSEKKLKTDMSKRIVPIHPILIKIGFTRFFDDRKKDKENLRLFPELPAGNTGYYSNPFSKWFNRFLVSIFGKENLRTGLSFHSFRHMVKDKLLEKGVSKELRETICGWGTNFKSSSEAGYGKGFSVEAKFDAIKVIEYHDLDLSHLYLDLSKLNPRARANFGKMLN